MRTFQRGTLYLGSFKFSCDIFSSLGGMRCCRPCPGHCGHQEGLAASEVLHKLAPPASVSGQFQVRTNFIIQRRQIIDLQENTVYELINLKPNEVFESSNVEMKL